MSQEKQKSTLSTPMEQLKASEDVISLGKRLVEELGMEPGVDTLGRWMAHYITELINTAEEAGDLNERCKIGEKCCNAILSLWQHRASLPRGVRPLGNLENVLKSVVRFRGDDNPWTLGLTMAEDYVDIGDPWIGFAEAIEKLGVRICRIALFMAISEENFGKEKR